MASWALTSMRNLICPPLIPIMTDIGSCICHLVWRCPKMSFRCEWTRQQTISQCNCNTWWYAHLQPYPRGAYQHLLQQMKTVKHHGIVFSSSKCWIRLSQIAYYSVVFTTQGMWLDPSQNPKSFKTFLHPIPQLNLSASSAWLTTYIPLFQASPVKCFY